MFVKGMLEKCTSVIPSAPLQPRSQPFCPQQPLPQPQPSYLIPVFLDCPYVTPRRNFCFNYLGNAQISWFLPSFNVSTSYMHELYAKVAGRLRQRLMHPETSAGGPSGFPVSTCKVHTIHTDVFCFGGTPASVMGVLFDASNRTSSLSHGTAKTANPLARTSVILYLRPPHLLQIYYHYNEPTLLHLKFVMPSAFNSVPIDPPGSTDMASFYSQLTLTPTLSLLTSLTKTSTNVSFCLNQLPYSAISKIYLLNIYAPVPSPPT
ncbi:hypothetical protein BX666DRAFT_2119533 [Dichotomocladium elegans]|nr:hypothetical protein BX666DRAFT_2119533 [Dichotomocladium elegans]